MDGSKTENGEGATFLDNQNKNKLCRYASTMWAELTTIVKAMSYFITKSYYKRIVIMTNSRNALKHLTHCTSGSRGTPYFTTYNPKI